MARNRSNDQRANAERANVIFRGIPHVRSHATNDENEVITMQSMVHPSSFILIFEGMDHAGILSQSGDVGRESDRSRKPAEQATE